VGDSSETTSCALSGIGTRQHDRGSGREAPWFDETEDSEARRLVQRIGNGARVTTSFAKPSDEEPSREAPVSPAN
jgi:hypothetical protein